MDDMQPESVDIKQYVALVWRWLWLIVLGTALAAAAALIVSRYITPVYEGVTIIRVSEGQKATGLDYNGLLMSERLAKTYALMLKSRPVLAEAGQRLGLALRADDITVEPVRDTQLVCLKARHAEPAVAAAIADTVPQVFIEQTARAREARVANASRDLNGQMAALQGEINAAQTSLAAERAKAQPDAAEVARLEALVAQHRSTLSGLLDSLQGIRLAEMQGADSLEVIEEAALPSAPVLPRTMTNTLLAGAVGALLAAGAAFLIEYLDDTIKRPEDVERTTRLPVFASVARFEATPDGMAPLVAKEPQIAVVEGYRILRTNLQFSTLGLGHSAVVLLVTGSQPGEGKTTTLANLGVSLAQAGKRVLLVDTDLRRPALHKQFGLQNKVGLTSLLLDGGARPEYVIQGTSVPGLGVLTSGPTPANPAELLDLPQMGATLDWLRKLVDYVLLDTPPVLSVADASILAQKVDGVLMVAEMGRVRSETFRQAVTTLQRVQARVLGVALNKVPGHGGSHYYHYYYGKPGEEPQRRRKKQPAPAAQSHG